MWRPAAQRHTVINAEFLGMKSIIKAKLHNCRFPWVTHLWRP